jgi:hypothetical protein
VGLIALLSSFFRTPMVALFSGVAVFFGLWVVNKILLFVHLNWKESTAGSWAGGAMYALPFRYEDLLLSHDPVRVAGGFAGFILWGAAMVALAAVVVKRRDI